MTVKHRLKHMQRKALATFQLPYINSYQ